MTLNDGSFLAAHSGGYRRCLRTARSDRSWDLGAPALKIGRSVQAITVCALSVRLARQRPYRRVVSGGRLGSILGKTCLRGHAAGHRNSNRLLRDESDETAPRSEQLRIWPHSWGN